MKIEYVLNRNDWIAYYNYYEEKHTQNSRRLGIPVRITLNFLVLIALMVILAVAIFYGLKLIGIATGYPLEKWFPWMPSPVPALVVLVIVSFILTWVFMVPRKSENVEKELQQNKIKAQVDGAIQARTINTACRYELEIRDAGLFQRSRLSENRSGVDYSYVAEMLVPWTSIRSIDVTEEHGFILMTEGFQFIVIVPNRSFPPEISFSSFMATVQRFFEKGSGSGTVSLGSKMPEEAIAIQPKRTWPT